MEAVENCLILALEANPDDWSVRLLLAGKQVEREAKKEASELIAAAPNPPKSGSDLKQMVDLIGEAAIPQLEKLVARSPNHAYGHQLLGHLLVLSGDEDRAEAHFEVAQGLSVLTNATLEELDTLNKPGSNENAEPSPQVASRHSEQQESAPAGDIEIASSITETPGDPLSGSPQSSFPPLTTPEIGPVEFSNTPSKKGAKLTAALVALAVHVVLAIIAALLVILPPTKEDPEIIASIERSKPKKQEMLKKTVAKQARKTNPSAAAAAPLAQLMRASAVAKISLPDVTKTSTGPLGIGESELGSGSFGASGLGTGEGMFMGSSVSGQMAVVFDISGSMYKANPIVIKEINKRFKSAQVVAVFGATFKRMDSGTRMLPYDKNREVLASVERNGKNQVATRDAMNKALFSLRHCDSLPGGKVGGNGLIPSQSLGRAIELLLHQPRARRPGTIFVFSDFQDGCDPSYMEEVCKLAWQNGTKLVFYHPVKFTKDKDKYLAVIKKTKVDGEVKEGL